MHRKLKPLPILIIAALAMALTSCGGPKAPSAQINAVAEPSGGGLVEYPEQNLKFTANEESILPLRIHLFDTYCESFRASIKVKSIDNTVAAQDLKTPDILKLDREYFDFLNKDGDAVCSNAEGNLDVQLVPGKYVLVVDGDEQPVNITVLPYGS